MKRVQRRTAQQVARTNMIEQAQARQRRTRPRQAKCVVDVHPRTNPLPNPMRRRQIHPLPAENIRASRPVLRQGLRLVNANFIYPPMTRIAFANPARHNLAQPARFANPVGNNFIRLARNAGRRNPVRIRNLQGAARLALMRSARRGQQVENFRMPAVQRLGQRRLARIVGRVDRRPDRQQLLRHLQMTPARPRKPFRPPRIKFTPFCAKMGNKFFPFFFRLNLD